MGSENLDKLMGNLEEYALKYTESLIALEFGVSLKVVHDYLRKKGINFRAVRNQQIRIFIRKNYRVKTAKQIAIELEMDTAAIEKRAREMGLRFGRGGDRRSVEYRRVLEEGKSVSSSE